MKFSVSNIAWENKDNFEVYQIMKECGYKGLEIAPTKIFPDQPYNHKREIQKWRMRLNQLYDFTISSMQSICFGRTENLFGCRDERNRLMSYVKQAIDFAEVVDCKNVVFGCPKNRIILQDADIGIGVDFFKELAVYALKHHTVISIEANPEIYGTNYINRTREALSLVKQVDSKGFRINLDLGTMIYYQENLEFLHSNISFVNHVHISEPDLRPIQDRKIHEELANLLSKEHYQGFISIEMKPLSNLNLLRDIMLYVREAFTI